MRRLFSLPASEAFDLKDRKRQNRNRNGLVGEREIHRNLIDQREDAQRRLQGDDAGQPNGAVDR